MTIEFGSIKSYNPDRGFGFVRRTFFNPNKNVFFHIRKIQKELPELAPRLDSNETFETINFWYEVETTEKGEQVSKLWLNADNIPQSYAPELDALIQKVESIWKNINSPKHTWLDLVTIKLVGVDRKNELSDERDNIKNQLRAAEEERLREAEALREIEIARAKALQEIEIARAKALRENEIERIAKKYKFGDVEADELHRLLEEMRPLNFRRSKELSAYIVKHQLGYKYPHISGIVRMRGRGGGEEGDFHRGFPPKLGYKYPHISGIVRMQREGEEWDFHGGFPPKLDYKYPHTSGIVRMQREGEEWDFHGGFPPDIYRIICEELGLRNQGTNAKAVKFTSFAEIAKNKKLNQQQRESYERFFEG